MWPNRVGGIAAVGIALFDDAVRRFVKPSGQPSHLKELLRVMDVTPAREKSDLDVAQKDAAMRAHPTQILVDGPFFAVSPHAMWSSVVVDQISRGTTSASPLTRLTDSNLSSTART